MVADLELDYLIVGAGIAGASLGYWLTAHGRTALLEREPQPGYHSTGRSAAMIVDSYGPPQVRSLTLASRPFFEHPPAGFSDHPLLTPRGGLAVAASEQTDLLMEHWTLVRAISEHAKLIDSSEARDLVPVLRSDRLAGAVYEPNDADIDVHALHQGFLRGVRAQGGHLICNTQIIDIQHAAERWTVQSTTGTYRARVLINAAGAWCDEVARLSGVPPIGLVPNRRSAFTFAPPQGMNVERWPMCTAVEWNWYIKPEAGLLLGSPANTDPVSPHDVQPEELDIALGIEAIEKWTHLTIRRPTRTWAGLRSFVADGNLVGGFDPEVPSFFWLAGQGGYGVQTSVAMGESCAALLAGKAIPNRVAGFGVTAADLSPARLRASSAGP